MGGMESVVQSDIFFFITAVAVIVLAALFAIALVYAIRILRDVKEVSSKVRAESDEIIHDVREARHFAKREGMRVASLVGFLGSFIRPKNGSRRAKGHKARRSEDADDAE